MKIGHRRIGWLRIGRDYLTLRDVEIGLVLGPRPDAPPYEIAWRWNFFVTWSWPRRLYRRISHPPHWHYSWGPVYSSAMWTGRTIAFCGWDFRHWWRWQRPRFSFLHIKD